MVVAQWEVSFRMTRMTNFFFLKRLVEQSANHKKTVFYLCTFSLSKIGYDAATGGGGQNGHGSRRGSRRDDRYHPYR